MSNNNLDIGAVLLYIYLIISQIATCYFWWLYASENGFFSTVFFGFFVAEFKGLLWPFFIF